MKRSNTVPACVRKFLLSKHHDDFIADNHLTEAQAAVVFFRRHTVAKATYAGELWDSWKYVTSHWWEIPVDPKRIAGIRPETLAKYQALINQISDELQDVQ